MLSFFFWTFLEAGLGSLARLFLPTQQPARMILSLLIGACLSFMGGLSPR